MKDNKPPCPKKEYQKVSFELKLIIIDQIQNGQISVNYAAKSYNVSRSSIDYWIKKYSTLEQKKRGMSKQDEIKKLKEKIEELEFIKEFQRDYIANLENLSGLDLAKKHLPEALAKEIEKRKRDLSK
ncbi:helix-turn-helix domain-containing protein [Aequorivita echinoideorum]|uniref:Helix-turn-helix domain-containing protein n=1 Tax=Aequorivita echinoideorum TaxID=1549647 RepID=A0ABS5S7M1_9FLAO|nr:helix-turn-helix domain-containing protein [Aequorivita echinoideorum]MBT0609202.1 helix-turn-helix domain-containing protein [Aequorivita echinoideorum]